MLGATEHQHLLPVLLDNQLPQYRRLGFLIYRVYPLFHTFSGGIAWRHLDLDGIVQDTFRQLPDLIGEGRRKQQVLAFGRQRLQDTPDVVDKAHIQHAIRFIKHQYLDFVKAHLTLLVQVQQAPRRRHQNVHALAQGRYLRVDFHPAKYHCRFQGQMLAIGLDAIGYLRG